VNEPLQHIVSQIRGEGTTEMSVDTSNGHPAMDYNQHKDTYNAFLRFSKIGIVLLVLLLAGMYFFLV
jgi:hypothetical protein